MSKPAQLAKDLAKAVGLRVRRAGLENRFDGMADSLALLRARGYTPRVVIDGGANLGQWSRMAAAVFPEAEFHMIEPQPVCHEVLRGMVGRGRHLHQVALSRPGSTTVTMTGLTGDSRNTGAYVIDAGDAAADTCSLPAATLDFLFDTRITAADRTLLKLDLEGSELAALEGAAAILPRLEVILSEVQFFEIERNGRATFADLSAWLRARNFELYDFACLAGRPRDGRLRMGDAVFARRNSALLADVAWA